MSDRPQPQPPQFVTENVSVPVTFQGFDDRVPQFVNVVQVSGDPTMIQVVLSQAVPPPVADAEALETIKVAGVKGHVINRVLLPPQAARELAEGILSVLRAMAQKEEGDKSSGS